MKTRTPRPAPDFVPIDRLRAHPLFQHLPYKFLEYHDRTVVRRIFHAGDVLCSEGDYGATAFLIIAGTLEVVVESPRGHVVVESPTPGRFDWLGRVVSRFQTEPQGEAVADPPASAPRVPILRTPEDLILGEMSCLSHHPRTATIRAHSDDAEVWEIRRNFLDTLRRSRGSRALLESIYRARAIPEMLGRAELFAGLPAADRAAIVAYLLPRVEFVRVDPGRVIFEQGEVADHLYLIRLGFVKVARTYGRSDLVLDYLGPDGHFGEIGLLTATAAEYLPSNAVAGGLPEGFARGRRTASCSALDDVELIRIRGEHFHELARTYESFREEIVRRALGYLSKNEETLQRMNAPTLGEALDQGIYHANRLLVLDLEKCTRCDECTQACADSHEGISRLTREGLRYGQFLVATSCRSCQDPFCLTGCPVDAIHRRPPTDERLGLEILIEPWCIGCGRCAENCPYGNINMHPVPPGAAAAEGQRAVAKKAVTCDLCRSISRNDTDEVCCVYACPHDAAHRKSGPELIELVMSNCGVGER